MMENKTCDLCGHNKQCNKIDRNYYCENCSKEVLPEVYGFPKIKRVGVSYTEYLGIENGCCGTTAVWMHKTDYDEWKKKKNE